MKAFQPIRREKMADKIRADTSVIQSCSRARVTEESYDYKALLSSQHIRILVIHPGDSLAMLSCSLEVLDLSQKPISRPFEAISYRWTGDDQPILCDGARVHASQNLYECLMQIRYKDAPRYVWADAICINQANDAEKTAQIALMSQVYRRCTSCIVWLGTLSFLDELAFSLLAKLAQTSVYSVSFDRDSSHAIPRSHKDALSYLLENDWFFRAWTFQEAVLPERLDFVCGSCTISGTDFRRAMLFIQKRELLHLLSDTDGFAQCLALLATRHTKQELSAVSLLNTLRSVRHRISRDPRDKVLSLGGLFEYQLFTVLRLSYNQSVSEIYCAVARHVLQEADSPDILLNAVTDNSATSKLLDHKIPSWAPDWGHCVPLTEQMVRFEERGFQAGGAGPMKFSVDKSGRVLRIHGKFVSRCEELPSFDSPLWHPGPDLDEVWEGEKLQVWNAGFSRIKCSPESLACGTSNLQSFKADFKSWITERKVAVAGAAGLGWVPLSAMIGDHVFVFQGCRLPFILRNADAEGTYRIVGHCFMHGIMEGQAMMRWNDNPLREISLV